ncbi:hypothetical protein JKP88DRAFT_337758 [Tribonema minus]|uniref:Uncharacterized protein n=1 Tax=Tribonema minus TaxID=303371 RepID=A0A835YR25_9STRA|nr:hypothetical protein JKP88DRAFT_337758 [Tribonema minus]
MSVPEVRVFQVMNEVRLLPKEAWSLNWESHMGLQPSAKFSLTQRSRRYYAGAVVSKRLVELEVKDLIGTPLPRLPDQLSRLKIVQYSRVRSIGIPQVKHIGCLEIDDRTDAGSECWVRKFLEGLKCSVQSLSLKTSHWAACTALSLPRGIETAHFEKRLDYTGVRKGLHRAPHSSTSSIGSAFGA